jgi:hypothetical protein
MKTSLEYIGLRGIQRFPQQSWEEKGATAEKTGRRSELGREKWAGGNDTPRESREEEEVDEGMKMGMGNRGLMRGRDEVPSDKTPINNALRGSCMHFLAAA